MHSQVTSVAFSSGGARLLSCGLDGMHTVALWDWRRGTLLLKAASSPRPVLGLAFLRPRHAAAATQPRSRAATQPRSRAAAQQRDRHATAACSHERPRARSRRRNRRVDRRVDRRRKVRGAADGVAEERIVVCGERELRFGRASSDERLVGLRWQKAVFGASAELQTLPCVAVNADGRVLTGSRRGELYVWQVRVAAARGAARARCERHVTAVCASAVCLTANCVTAICVTAICAPRV